MTRRDRVQLISAGSPSSDYSIAHHKHQGWQHSEASAPKDTGIKPPALFPFKLQVNTPRACLCPFFYLRLHATRCPWLLGSPQSAQGEVTMLWPPRSHAKPPVPSTQGCPARQRAGPEATMTAAFGGECGEMWDQQTQGSPYSKPRSGCSPWKRLEQEKGKSFWRDPKERHLPRVLAFPCDAAGLQRELGGRRVPTLTDSGWGGFISASSISWAPASVAQPPPSLFSLLIPVHCPSCGLIKNLRGHV